MGALHSHNILEIYQWQQLLERRGEKSAFELRLTIEVTQIPPNFRAQYFSCYWASQYSRIIQASHSLLSHEESVCNSMSFSSQVVLTCYLSAKLSQETENTSTKISATRGGIWYPS